MVCKKCGKEFFEDWRKLKKANLPDFCSRSCTNGSNNLRYTEAIYCLGCGKLLGSGYLFSKRKYCSNKCQAKKKQGELLKDWLKTGKLESASKTANSSKSLFVRDFILREQNNVCAICNFPFVWRNLLLIPVLDHIDGCCLNNRRENLRLICSNCDSQLQTYKGKNKGKGRRSLGFTTNKGL